MQTLAEVHMSSGSVRFYVCRSKLLTSACVKSKCRAIGKLGYHDGKLGLVFVHTHNLNWRIINVISFTKLYVSSM